MAGPVQHFHSHRLPPHGASHLTRLYRTYRPDANSCVMRGQFSSSNNWAYFSASGPLTGTSSCNAYPFSQLDLVEQRQPIASFNCSSVGECCGCDSPVHSELQARPWVQSAFMCRAAVIH